MNEQKWINVGSGLPEIIKAFNDCLTNRIRYLCFKNIKGEVYMLSFADVLDLINRQKAEIERLNKTLVFEINSAFERGKAEATTEFAERLKEEAEYLSIDREGDFVFFYKGNDFEMYDTVSEWLAKAIDQIAKEMKGEQ